MISLLLLFEIIIIYYGGFIIYYLLVYYYILVSVVVAVVVCVILSPLLLLSPSFHSIHRSSKEGSQRSSNSVILEGSNLHKCAPYHFTEFLFLSASSKTMSLAAWVITALLCICTKTTLSLTSVKWKFSRSDNILYTRR